MIFFKDFVVVVVVVIGVYIAFKMIGKVYFWN